MFNRDKLLVLILLLIVGSAINCKRNQEKIIRTQLFDLNWKFSLGDIQSANLVEFDDNKWQNIDLPHDWSKDKELLNKTASGLNLSIPLEVGWYRKQFTIPEDWTNKSIVINFEGLCHQSEIFVNGITIKSSNSENTSLQAILNPYLNVHGKNVIAVRVTIPKHLDSDSCTESGIYKHVWLVIKEQSDLRNKKSPFK